ncbi:hypothetical protein HK405_014947, partial [Cladochytrium tenue]
MDPPPPPPPPPRVLSVAGSDSSGGAGIQADIKTLQALGVYAATAVTAVTEQTTSGGVAAVYPIAPAAVASQLVAVLRDVGADAVKTGMLVDGATVRAVAAALREEEEEAESVAKPTGGETAAATSDADAGTDTNSIRRRRRPWLVVDPVMAATAGGTALLDPARDALEALRSDLLPLADVVTPNVPEAEALAGAEAAARAREEPDGVERLRKLALAVAALGPRHVLVKGGHAPVERGGSGRQVVVDVLWNGRTFVEFENAYVETPNTHGTGCTLSAALAGGLAKGLS